MNETVSIIIPVYNEKDHIMKLVHDIHERMDSSGFNFELILVDDGSTDGGSEVVNQLAMPDVKKVVHSHNKGYGAALKSGILAAENDIIVITDADGTYPSEMIPELIREIDGCEMVVGARTGREVRVPFPRRPAKWFIGKLANYLSGMKIPDLNSGLRVMRKDVVSRFIRLLPDGFSFTTTITIAMLTNGYSVKYVPINYYRREGKSKIRPIEDTLNFIQLIIRTSLYFNPLRVFVPLSFLLVVFAFLVLVGSWLITGRVMDMTFGIVMMTAVIVMTVGMLADVIDKKSSLK